ncbi:PPC domain-containing protein [Thermopirellula anaerolimosa]
MKASRSRTAVLAALCVATWLPAVAPAQQRTPAIGYVYPAGGQSGTTFQVTVGGQFLDGVRQIVFSGEGLPNDGIQAKVVRFIKPLTQKQVNDLQEKLMQLRERVREETSRRRRMGLPADYMSILIDVAKDAGISAEDIKALEEYRRIRNDPKRQPNPQIADRLIVEITVSPEVPQGTYLLRVAGAAAISNPLRFQVGPWREVSEQEPNEGDQPCNITGALPFVVNGQILPGDVDRFRFSAKKGQRLTAVVFARELIPYLADAVPGWFQATLSLQTADGKELVYVDDYRFHPDPVLSAEIPADGDYVLEIKDSVFRGREDFVYRMVVGDIPFVTAIEPAGLRQGETRAFRLDGWNLSRRTLTISAAELTPGIHSLSPAQMNGALGRVLFAVDSLPDIAEKEPNDGPGQAQTVPLGTVVNGAIDRAGDHDFYAFTGKKGEEVVLEITARRLGSPVDSFLRLIAPDGRQVAMGDDWEDKGVGWLTHHADSYVRAGLPQDGQYRVEVRDMQQGGGEDYLYRLRISRPLPDFQLRVVPSCLNVQPGTTVPVDVYALRKDGFDGEIKLSMTGAGEELRLSGNRIPAGQERVRMTVTVPPSFSPDPLQPRLLGEAVIAGNTVTRQAVAADDLMQAFFYRHLVAADPWTIYVGGRSRFTPALTPAGTLPVKLPVGGTATVRYWLPRFARGANIAALQWELLEPNEGISLGKVSVSQDRISVPIQAAAELTPGLQGNLILQLFSEQKRPNSNQSIKIFVGVLPAIPFEVVPAGETAENADAANGSRS